MSHEQEKEAIGRSYMTTAAKLNRRQIADIVTCAQRAFGADMGEQEVLDHLKGELAIVENGEGTIVGFGAVTVSSPRRIARSEHVDFLPADLPRPDRMAYYLAAAAVHPDYQGQGVYRALTMRRLAYAIKRNAKTVITRTQNFRVEAGIRACLEELKNTNIIRGFTLSRVRMPGFYGRRLVADSSAPPAGSPFEPLDLDKGDALMLIFSIRYLKSMSRAS